MLQQLEAMDTDLVNKMAQEHGFHNQWLEQKKTSRAPLRTDGQQVFHFRSASQAEVISQSNVATTQVHAAVPSALAPGMILFQGVVGRSSCYSVPTSPLRGYTHPPLAMATLSCAPTSSWCGTALPLPQRGATSGARQRVLSPITTNAISSPS